MQLIPEGDIHGGYLLALSRGYKLVLYSIEIENLTGTILSKNL
jgi:hypothetical protein